MGLAPRFCCHFGDTHFGLIAQLGCVGWLLCWLFFILTLLLAGYSLPFLVFLALFGIGSGSLSLAQLVELLL